MTDVKDSKSMLRYAGLATQWLIMLLVAVWIGHKIDVWTAWKIPVFIILLPFLSLIFSLWQLIKEFNKPRSEKK